MYDRRRSTKIVSERMKKSDMDLGHTQKLLPLVYGFGSLFYFVLTALHLLVLESHSGLWMSTISLSSGIMGAAFWNHWKFNSVPRRQAYWWMTIWLIVGELNGLALIGFSQDLRQVSNLALLIIVSGYFFCNARWFRSVILAQVILAFSSFWLVEQQSGQLHFVIMLVISVGIAWVLRAARVRFLYSEERLQIALDAADLGCFDWNSATNDLHWDHKMHRLFGMEIDAVGDRREIFNKLLHPDDLNSIGSDSIMGFPASEDVEVDRVEFRILLDRSEVFIEAYATRIQIGAGTTVRIAGTCRDITGRRHEIERAHDSKLRAMKQRAAIASLAFHPAISNGDLQEALCELAKTAANALEVERVGIWFLSDDEQELVCQKLFRRSTKKCSSGASLRKADFPRYFDLIQKQSTIIADDAQAAEVTSEFVETYLVPNGITSMIDSAIFVEGKVVGVVCIEHTGPKREWSGDEQAFTNTLASFVVQALLNAARKKTDADHRFLLDHMHAAVVVHAPDTSILTCNRLANEWLGKREDEIQGLTALDETWDFIFEDGSKVPIKSYPANVVVKTMQPIEELVLGIRKTVSNEVIWVLLNAYPVFDSNDALRRIVVTFVDITLRKKAESDLLESERRYRLLVEKSPFCIHEIEQSGNLASMNPSGLKMLGLSHQDELVDVNYFDLVCPDDARRIGDLFEESLSGRTLEFEFKGANGRHFASSFVPIFREDGSIDRIMGISNDVTARLDAEENRRVLEEQLSQSQKMDAVGQLAGGIAHDFNNHLHAIKTFAELAIEQSTQNDTRSGFLPEIIKSADQATSLVSQLLAFSRQQILELQVIDVDKVLDDTFAMLSRIIGENIELKRIRSDGKRFVQADPVQIGQIVTNLCLNSRDAIVGIGMISLHTESVSLDEAFCETNRWARPGSFAKISVCDNGCGIDSPTLKKVFEPFFTTKAVGKGTGIGLSIVYGIVHQHQGLVNVISEMDMGTTFEVYFPLDGSKANESVAIPLKTQCGAGESILLVEDEELVRRANTELLKLAGYRVVTAIDGEEALKVFHQNKDEIDLVVLDVVMPKLGGKEVGDQIAMVRPELPVLYISGYSIASIDSSLITDANIQLIQKPFRANDFLEKIRQMLNR